MDPAWRRSKSSLAGNRSKGPNESACSLLFLVWQWKWNFCLYWRLNKQHPLVGPIGAFPLCQQLVTSWPSSADSRIETSSPFFLEFFCDVWCLYNGGLGWCSYHDAGCYPRRQWRPTLGSVYSRTVIRILLMFHCNRQLSEGYNFESLNPPFEALLCSVYYYIQSNLTCNLSTVGKIGRLCGDHLKANNSNVWWTLFLAGIHNFACL